eukprot:CAMPEP_0179316054 /NCGR_PEP_ID=MMETSP0797-20121207/55455_1 /TAXON_ID=47934 /ORGANISM="Dinophysis acuminata, Strain DAEP01" /LENGTH=88 /DNA_ID=CAMNT_0021026749 /DNA_START=202 /DNA_END=466 /DNA_ORIENTATION=-
MASGELTLPGSANGWESMPPRTDLRDAAHPAAGCSSDCVVPAPAHCDPALSNDLACPRSCRSHKSPQIRQLVRRGTAAALLAATLEFE